MLVSSPRVIDPIGVVRAESEADCFVTGAGFALTGFVVIPRPGGLLARRYPNAAVMLGNSLVPT